VNELPHRNDVSIVPTSERRDHCLVRAPVETKRRLAAHDVNSCAQLGQTIARPTF
jgi:hypothetical protein